MTNIITDLIASLEDICILQRINKIKAKNTELSATDALTLPHNVISWSLLYILCDRPHCGFFICMYHSISVCVGLCIYVPVLLLVFVQHFIQ